MYIYRINVKKERKQRYQSGQFDQSSYSYKSFGVDMINIYIIKIDKVIHPACRGVSEDPCP